MVWALLLIWDALNALGLVYPGFFSLIFKTIIVLLLLWLGSLRFSKLIGTQLNIFNSDINSNTRKIIIISIAWGVLIFNWWFMTFFKGMWLANHNNFAPGFSYITNYGITTSLTRYWQAETCPNEQKPCHVYITLPEDALTGVFVNFQLNPESCPKGKCFPLVEICKVNSVISEWKDWKIHIPIKGEYKVPEHEYSQRNVYSVLVQNLEEKATYAIKIVHERWDNSKAQVYYYRNFNTQKITIVNGGDIGNVQPASNIHKNVVSQVDADLIFVGGDIAYDNGIPEWYRWYDHILKRLPHQRTDPNTGFIRLIPLIFSTGNHDVGVNSYSGHTIEHNENSPVFKHFFPQNTFNENVPKLSERKTYFTHRIGTRLLLLSLDTGYELPIANQTTWIESQLSERSYQFIFSQYHHPLYAACSKGNRGVTSGEGRKHWVPLFDKYNVTMSFENHVHSFKRTKPLRGGVPSPNGTVYLGDGSWGPLYPHCKLINKELMEVADTINHVWIINIDETNVIQGTAYDQEGKVLDTFNLVV